jgi:hypothetical protein
MMLFWVFVQILFRIRSDGFSLWFYVQIFGIKYVNQSQWVGYPVDPERQIPSYWPGWLWETKSAQFSNVCTQIVVASDTFSSAAAVFTKQVLKNTLWNTVEKNTMWTFVEFLVRISSRGKKKLYLPAWISSLILSWYSDIYEKKLQWLWLDILDMQNFCRQGTNISCGMQFLQQIWRRNAKSSNWSGSLGSRPARGIHRNPGRNPGRAMMLEHDGQS